MKKLSFATVACLALVALATTAGFANAIPPQVTLSLGTSGNVAFSTVGNVINVSFTGNSGQCGHANCVGGAALLDLGTSQTLGSYTMWMTGGPLSLTGGPSDFTAMKGSSAIYLEVKLGSNGSLGDLITTISLDTLTGGSTNTPQLSGDFWASTSTLGFTKYFVNGVPGEIDFTVKLPPNSSLGPNGSTVSGYLSSGELVPSVPEPGTIALLGSGIIGLAGVIRRRMI